MTSKSTRPAVRRAVGLLLFLVAVTVAVLMKPDVFRPILRFLPESCHFAMDASDDDHAHSETEAHEDHQHDEDGTAGHEDHRHAADGESASEKNHATESGSADDGEESDHDHEHEAESLSLDDASLFNIGIGSDGTITLAPEDYAKSFRIPGVVREIAGRSTVHTAATVSGIVTNVSVRPGETLCPGEPILEIMLTHEEAVQCQTDLIALLQKRDVLVMETERLGALADGIAPKQQRELHLQKITNDAAILSQRNLLKIHGFTDAIIDETVVSKRQAITHLTVRVPSVDENGLESTASEQHTGDDTGDHYLILESLLVNKGDSVEMGDILCRISDFRTLQIEGKAFASEENLLNGALLTSSPVAAVFDDSVTSGAREKVENLRIARTDSFVDSRTQTVSCWVPLTNRRLETSGEAEMSGGVCDPRTIHWRFKPGQRCKLEIAEETIPGVFVLPPEAVALDRSGAFVFEMSEIHEGKRVWTKRPVRVLDRTGEAVVIAADETIHTGMKIAQTGADQLYVALGSGSGKLQSACEHDH